MCFHTYFIITIWYPMCHVVMHAYKAYMKGQKYV